MLTNLHVKNLALIEEADIDFKNGLNILTGETGAGKSIILGSVNIALGGKVNADIIRKGCDYALTELTFKVNSSDKIKQLKEYGIEELEEGIIIISRKITPSKSTIRINGETFTISEVKAVSHILIDIHGQHDNQILLKESTHIDMVDLFGRNIIEPLSDAYTKLYNAYNEIDNKIKSMSSDEAARNREIDLLEYQINEITEASLKPCEDEHLENTFKKMSNYQKIAQHMSAAKQILDNDEASVSDCIGQSVKLLTQASVYDEALSDIVNTLSSAEDIINDALMEMSDYMESFDFNEEDYNNMSKRLDLIHSLKLKYGRTIDEIHEYVLSSQKKLDELLNFNEIQAGLKTQLTDINKKLTEAADKLTAARKKSADKLCKSVSEGLFELNFLNNDFKPEFEKTEKFQADGTDKMRFLISTNVGEDLKPLSKVASGGELSSIMLAFKTVIADKDNTDTLIFDEIDAGISGVTAQMVGNKLSQLSSSHQIICITHLPQIAAMADEHYIIEKKADKTTTVTDIRSLNEEESVNELARLLGGASITAAALNNAREMKKLAKKK